MKVCLYGDPCLRKVASPICDLDKAQEIASHMLQAMKSYDGIGIAAPQIRINYRMFAVSIPAGIHCRNTEGEIVIGASPTVFLNPSLSDFSQSMVDFEEGCLSIPCLKETVSRPSTVVLHATLLSGQEISLMCGGLLGRCVQHECDHLDGILFVDLLPKKVRKKIEPDLKKLRKKVIR